MSRLILLDMGGLLPQSEGKQDWPSYSYKTFPLAYLPDPRIAQIQADLTLQDVHKLYLLSKNQIEFVSRILVITGIFGHFQQKTFGEDLSAQIARIFQDFWDSTVTGSRRERRERRTWSAASVTECSAVIEISENRAA